MTSTRNQKQYKELFLELGAFHLEVKWVWKRFFQLKTPGSDTTKSNINSYSLDIAFISFFFFFGM